MTQNIKKNPKKYLGWKNQKTWNVMLHLNNDGYIDSLKNNLEYEFNNRDNVKSIVRNIDTYKLFIEYFNLQDTHTMDDVNYLDDTLDYKELNEIIFEIVSSYAV